MHISAHHSRIPLYAIKMTVPKRSDTPIQTSKFNGFLIIFDKHFTQFHLIEFPSHNVNANININFGVALMLVFFPCVFCWCLYICGVFLFIRFILDVIGVSKWKFLMKFLLFFSLRVYALLLLLPLRTIVIPVGQLMVNCCTLNDIIYIVWIV